MIYYYYAMKLVKLKKLFCTAIQNVFLNKHLDYTTIKNNSEMELPICKLFLKCV